MCECEANPNYSLLFHYTLVSRPSWHETTVQEVQNKQNIGVGAIFIMGEIFECPVPCIATSGCQFQGSSVEKEEEL